MSEDPITGLAREIRILTGIISKQISRAFEHRLSATQPGVSGLQFGVLRLVGTGESTISELSSKMMLAPATLVPAVDKLEKEGFLLRGKDPRDRRRNPITLTDKGLQLLSQVAFVSPEDTLYGALANMGVDEGRRLDDLLRRLVERLYPGTEPPEELLARLSADKQ